MKRNLFMPLVLVLFLSLSSQFSTLLAQGTAFAYEGQLQDSGGPANGTYNFMFSLYTANSGGAPVAGPVSVNGVVVNNGLFTVTIDFGPSPWNGAINWLEIGVEGNGASTFTTLTPRQQLMPTPYAIFATTSGNLSGLLPASQLSGTVGNGQLASSSVTINAGTGLSGGGPVALGSATTLNNTGVTSLTGGGGVTVSATSGSVTLGSTATSGDIANAIVSRDSTGSFSADSLTLDGALYLPGPPLTIYSGSFSLLQEYGNNNLFIGPQAGNSTASGSANIGIGPQTLLKNASGSANIAIGGGALANNTSGGGNIAIGNGALANNMNGIQNTAIGVSALSANTAGDANTAVGTEALLANTTGHDNTANGAGALVENTAGTLNTATGSGALGSNGGGNQNTANGYNSLYNNLGGSANTANGASTLYNNTTGGNNTANGFQALYVNKTGINNTADGVSALQDLPTGTNNTALGFYAGANFTGIESSNIDIGNPGVVGDNNTIRIGSGHSRTFIAGVINGNGGGLTNISATAVTAFPIGMVLVPAGSFTMGDSLDAEADAIPTVSVTVSGFYMDTTLVSWSQWQSVYIWATSHGYTFDDAGTGSAPNQPVQMLNWYDVAKWCNARSEQAGRTPVYFTDGTQTTVYRTGDVDLVNVCVNWNGTGYRLPTEAEWEKAARGGLSGQRFPWGNFITGNLANYDGCTSICPWTYDLGPDGFNPFNPSTTPGTTPVDYFAPNGYGLHDMAGNLFEWCWDWYPIYSKQYAGGTDPRGPATVEYDRTYRGGSWGLVGGAYGCRCAARYFSVPPGVYNYLGFRTVVSSGN
jgi:formylglycine-generating enzyme required for sulfatase activity